MIESQILATVSATASVNSVPFQIDDLTVYSVQVTFSGLNVVGTLTLQASNDAVTWIDIEDSAQAVTASSSHMWNVKGAGYRWSRAAWVYTSGTGNIGMTVCIKENVIKGA